MNSYLAEEIARKAHEGQIYGGKDYFQHHILGVEEKVLYLFDYNEDLRIVALLHDVLEDTDVTGQELCVDFDDTVMDALIAITKLPDESQSEYLARVMKNPIALKVKIADTMFNLKECIQDNDLERSVYYAKRLVKLQKGNHETN